MKVRQRRFISANRSSIKYCGICACSRRRYVVKSLRFRGGLNRIEICLPSMLHTKFKSGERAGHSNGSNVSRSTYWLTTRALCTLVLSSINMASEPTAARYQRTYGSRITSRKIPAVTESR
ncbi:hypothetical protein TNCV_281641 [Trichonephila clavipes]|nr:hypothetical protein TNCV_281641 [Trichonephila clavipes]